MKQRAPAHRHVRGPPPSLQGSIRIERDTRGLQMKCLHRFASLCGHCVCGTRGDQPDSENDPPSSLSQ